MEHPRWILVPKNKEAMCLLDHDQESEEDVEQWLLSEEDFSCLWRSGVFEKINTIADAHIDDFEDYSLVEIPVLRNVAQFLEQLSGDTRLGKLRGMVRLALKYQTGIFFYF